MKKIHFAIGALAVFATLGTSAAAAAPTQTDDGSSSMTSAATAHPGGGSEGNVKGSVLNVGDSLADGEHISSPNRHYTLTYRESTGLVLAGKDGHAIWSSEAIPGAKRAMMRDDNNLMYRGDVYREWSSNTKDLVTVAEGPLQAVVTCNGKLQIRTVKGGTVLWENGRAIERSKGSVLNPTDYLMKGQYLTSPNGKYKLLMQEDSNLVLSGPAGTIWFSGVVKDAPSVTMTGDGDLVIPQPGSWNTATKYRVTAATGALQLALTDTGKVQIRGTKGSHQVVWENGTYVPESKGSVLDVNEYLGKGQYLVSPNGKYTLSYGADSNLVLQGPNGTVRVGGFFGGRRALMGADNNLCIFFDTAPIGWSSKTGPAATAETGPLQLVVTDDGKAQIRGTKGEKKVVWENGHLV